MADGLYIGNMLPKLWNSSTRKSQEDMTTPSTGVDSPAYPTQYRAGYDAAQAAPVAPPAVPSAPSAAPAANGDGLQSKPVPSPYPLLIPQQGPGYRAAMPEYPRIQFNAAPPAVANAANANPYAGAGSLSGETMGQLDDLYREARPLLSSRGIVDRFRGRQLLGARSRLLEGATRIAGTRVAGINAESSAASSAIGANASMLSAQTGAFRASNEVPLGMLQAYSHRYAADVGAQTQLGVAGMHSDTSRYVSDQANESHRYGIDADVAKSLPTIQRNAQVNSMYNDGNTEGAHELAGIGLRDTRPVLPKLDFNPANPDVAFSTHPDGSIRVHSVKQMMTDQAEADRKKVRSSVSKDIAK